MKQHEATWNIFHVTLRHIPRMIRQHHRNRIRDLQTPKTKVAFYPSISTLPRFHTKKAKSFLRENKHPPPQNYLHQPKTKSASTENKSSSLPHQVSLPSLAAWHDTSSTPKCLSGRRRVVRVTRWKCVQ
jgi:hypothetical protein